MVGDVPVQIGLVHAVYRDQEHVLDLSVAKIDGETALRKVSLCPPDLILLDVVMPGMDGVAVVFPYDTMQVDQTLLAGRDPGTMACSDDPGYLFVASSTGSDVCILNIDTRKVIGFVEIGGRPSFITITPDSQYALILDQFAGDMGVVHIPAIKIRGDAGRLKTGAALFTMLSVGSNPVDAVVIPKVV